jgi:hypothetical protein
MLASRMVGMLHAPAWQETVALKAEFLAIADVYAARLGPTARVHALVSALVRAIGTCGQLPVSPTPKSTTLPGL